MSSFGRAWQAKVWDCWRGGHVLQLARLLANDLLDTHTHTVELDREAVNRLLHQVNLRPPGLRQLLTRLAEAGLLVQLRPGDGENWGTCRLVLPSTPPDCTAKPEEENNDNRTSNE